MPFDAMTRSRPEAPDDQLAALGITPVPRDVLYRHKAKMLDGLEKRQPWVKWREQRIELSHLAWLHLVFPSELSRWRTAPRSVRRLAAKVQHAIPDATFYLGYIQRDPYLMVHYDTHWECLAIWLTRFRAIALAKQR